MGNIFKPFYRRVRDTAYSLLPIRTCREGFKFEGSLDRFENSADEIGTQIAIKLLSPKLTRFVNPGANAGYFCLLAEKFGLSCIAFEPEPKMFRRLQRNLAANNSSCIAIPAALSNTCGIAEFFGTGTAGSLIPGLSGTPSWDKQTVPTVQVDQFLGSIAGPELWLMDCEGAEPLIIEGSRAYIQSKKPLFIIEYEPSRDSEGWKDIIRLFRELGYSHCAPLSELAAKKRLSTFTIQELTKYSGDNILLFDAIHHQEVVSQLLN